MSEQAPPLPTNARPSRAIARQLALGFGLVSFVAVAMCVLLLQRLDAVAGHVDHMRAGESAIQQSGELATAVREQYMHLAHSFLLEDVSHTHHYKEWADRVTHNLERLRGVAPASERWRLDEIATARLELEQLLEQRLAPALAKGQSAGLKHDHERAEALTRAASEHADAVAMAVEQSMVGAHISARGAARFGLIVGMICVALVLALSIGYTLRLRSSVLRPLRHLTNTARDFAAGDLSGRLGSIGRGELQEVASAFDHMADELVVRERRIRDSERMAAIGQLAAGVAHELNNPIAVIRGYLKTMDPEESKEELAEELRILDEEAEACQRIAADLLTYSAVPTVRAAKVEMHTWLAESIRRIGGSDIAAARIDLRAEPGVIRADHRQLRQVLANLLANAAQASPDESSIEVRGGPTDDGGYRLSVADQGHGIPESERAAVFEPFYTKRTAGTGLGLAVCRGIVQSHGGRIWVEDARDGGARFVMELPAAPPIEIEEAA